MYRIKNWGTVFFLFVSIVTFSQKKETVYLLFNEYDCSKKCVIEDGAGNSSQECKYRKWHGENHIDFMICDENFRIYDTKKSDTSSVKILERINCVNTKYLNDEKSKTILRQHPFEKIFILEKISADKVVKHEVIWVDEWVEIY